MSATVVITLEAFSQTADEISAMFKDSLRRHGIDVSSVHVSIEHEGEPWPVETWDDPRVQAVLTEIAAATQPFSVEVGQVECGCPKAAITFDDATQTRGTLQPLRCSCPTCGGERS